MSTPPEWGAESFRDLVEHVPAVLYEAEPGRAGHWHYLSRHIEELIGDSPADWLSDPQRYLDRVHPDDREAVVTTELREFELARGSAVTYVSEYRMVRDDGGVVWIRDEARLATDREPPVWRGILIDITKEREAGAALDEAHAQAGELVDASNAGDGDDLAAARSQIDRLLTGIQAQMRILDRGRRPPPKPGSSGTSRRVFTSLDDAEQSRR